MKGVNYADLFIELKTGPYAYTRPVDRFWESVDSSGEDCWPWKGKIASNGYGLFPVRNKAYLAHRVAFLLDAGGLDERNVCHMCDNRACVNPCHLFLGTQSENVQDMLSKGRNNPPRGERSSRAKLCWVDVLTIRGLHRNGTPQKDLAHQFGLSQKQISVIVNNKQWRLDLDTYQSICLDLALWPTPGHNLTYPVLGFVGEAGEVANKYKKVLRGDTDLTEEKRAELIDELSDCLYYLAAVAFELGISMSELAVLNTNKLRSRQFRNVLKGDGDNR